MCSSPGPRRPCCPRSPAAQPMSHCSTYSPVTDCELQQRRASISDPAASADRLARPGGPSAGKINTGRLATIRCGAAVWQVKSDPSRLSLSPTSHLGSAGCWDATALQCWPTALSIKRFLQPTHCSLCSDFPWDFYRYYLLSRPDEASHLRCQPDGWKLCITFSSQYSIIPTAIGKCQNGFHYFCHFCPSQPLLRVNLSSLTGVRFFLIWPTSNSYTITYINKHQNKHGEE